MRFINKFSLCIFLLIGFLIRFLFPAEFRVLYFNIFMTITAFLVGILIYKYKCINLIAGIDSNKGNESNIENTSKYVGRLMFLIAFILGIATLLSLFVDGLFKSWYMVFFVGPIVVYAFYCLVKINQA